MLYRKRFIDSYPVMTQPQKSLVNQFRKITFDSNSNSMHEWLK